MIVVEMGFKSYVMTTEQALELTAILEKVELYERKYIPKQERAEGTSDYTHHVYANHEGFSMRTLNESLYQMAKLAGKPTKEK